MNPELLAHVNPKPRPDPQDAKALNFTAPLTLQAPKLSSQVQYAEPRPQETDLSCQVGAL